MNILMLSPHGTITPTPPLGAPDTGGQVVQVLGLAKELGRRGHTVTVANRTWGSDVFYSVAENVGLWRVACGPSRFVPKEEIGDVLGEFSAAVLHLVSGRFDVVVGHYWDGMWAAVDVADVLDRPVVVMPHSLGMWKAEAMGEDHHLLREAVEQRTMTVADLIVATSPLQHELVGHYYDTDQPVAVIPPAIDADFLLNDAMPSPFGSRSVLAVGRAAENKNYLGLVTAVGIAHLEIPDIQLHIVAGSDPTTEREVTAHARTHGFGNRVHVHSRLTHQGLLSAYRGSALFAMPSLYEPFGMTAAEAMGSGVPALIPDDGGLASALPDQAEAGRCAYAVPPYDPGAVAQGIIDALRGGDRIARNGQSWARANLSWPVIAGEWERNLSRVLS